MVVVLYELCSDTINLNVMWRLSVCLHMEKSFVTSYNYIFSLQPAAQTSNLPGGGGRRGATLLMCCLINLNKEISTASLVPRFTYLPIFIILESGYRFLAANFLWSSLDCSRATVLFPNARRPERGCALRGLS